ncbi:MAG: acyl transferase, partial [Ferruginibacter sp.]
STNSKHFVKEKKLYEESYLKTFRNFYGSENNYCIIGLLPSYLERQNSSLVYMVDDLIKKSEHKNSGFYLYDYEKLKKILLENEATKQPTLLIGVTYALVDFAELNKINLQHTTIIETGGMKGRRDELSRKEVHQILTQNLAVQNIHSEYGMTELLSQAYSTGNGFFTTPTYMQILLRSKDDPFEIYSKVHTVQNTLAGGVNIIDLANLYSCAFIATDDAGILYPNNSFEIIGRLENCDIRGCSLMVAE